MKNLSIVTKCSNCNNYLNDDEIDLCIDCSINEQDFGDVELEQSYHNYFEYREELENLKENERLLEELNQESYRYYFDDDYDCEIEEA